MSRFWGNWRAHDGVVHAVKGYGFQIDYEFLWEGWETLCCLASWEEDGPKVTKKPATCLLCIGEP